MDVKVEQFKSWSMRDPTIPVYPRLWRIWVDGRHAGVMGKQDGAKLLMHLRFPPEMMRDIERQVAEQVAELTETKEEKVWSIMPPKLPEEMKQQEDDGIDDDDFN